MNKSRKYALDLIDNISITIDELGLVPSIPVTDDFNIKSELNLDKIRLELEKPTIDDVIDTINKMIKDTHKSRDKSSITSSIYCSRRVNVLREIKTELKSEYFPPF